MLLTIAEFREAVRSDRPALIAALKSATGRGGDDEREAWESSLPALAEVLAAPALGPLHLYLGGHGYLALEYQLPAASSWCDVVLLGRGAFKPSVVIVELKHWITRGDRPGPAEGLMERAGSIALHPADQVRGYTEYCRRFHSAVQDQRADVRGCVLFTRDYFAEAYADPPNDTLVRDYPCFTLSPNVVREVWPVYLARTLKAPDEQFAHAFVAGRYRQDRGFVRQIGAQIRDRANSPFELLDHQRRAFALVRARLESEVLGRSSPRKQVIVIQGPPGSGKSVSRRASGPRSSPTSGCRKVPPFLPPRPRRRLVTGRSSFRWPATPKLPAASSSVLRATCRLPRKRSVGCAASTAPPLPATPRHGATTSNCCATGVCRSRTAPATSSTSSR
ncbi:MAG: hypothetical protein IPK20_20080 [Betaproteobacteria bacterium]|nr:hypothetical protein [Betaproteobacteria bacterium]